MLNFKLAWRQLNRNKGYAAINLTGLSVGLAACLLIFALVRHEFSYDHFWPGKDRIYRVYTEYSGVFSGTNRGVPSAMATWVGDNSAGLSEWTAFYTVGSDVAILRENGAPVEWGYQNDLAVTDPSYFRLWSEYQWLAGDAERALSAPAEVVLTAEKARQYFDLEEPTRAMGRQVQYNDGYVATVVGVVSLDGRSDLYFGDFLSLASVEDSWLRERIELDNWGNVNSGSQLFIKLRQGIEQEEVAELLANADPDREETAANGYQRSFALQPFSDLHFNGDLGLFDSSRATAKKPILLVLSIVALLLLLIAGVNFINLKTAQAAERGREVGVRKVLGGSRRELIGQFLGETFVLTTIAVIIGVAFTELGLRYLQDFFPAGVSFELSDPITLLFLAGTILIVSLMAGLYPAFVLSSYQPVDAMRSRVVTPKGASDRSLIRRGLVIGQFVIAQVLVFATLLIGNQIQFMLEKDMGFEQDAIVFFSAPFRDTTQSIPLLNEEIGRLAGVQEHSIHRSPPASTSTSTSSIRYGEGENGGYTDVQMMYGDTAFMQLYGIKLLAGRNYRPNSSDRELVINETYMRHLGFEEPQSILGEQVDYGDNMVEIVGVVADFHQSALSERIRPCALIAGEDLSTMLAMKLATEGRSIANFESLIGSVETLYERFYPEATFDYRFLDESIAAFYTSEEKMSKLASTATLLAILLSCLGLLGLISFAAARRTKEIGVRKVMGATVPNIVQLLSRDFLLLVCYAFVAALPIAWLLGQQFYQFYAYHPPTPWWLPLMVLAGTLLIAFLTVSLQSLRAALANPIESLRTE